MANGGSLAATDVQPNNESHLDGKGCVGYALDRAREYGAQLRFIGLMAGVGDPADVQTARQMVKDILSNIMKSGGTEDTFDRDWRNAEAARDAASRDFGSALTRYRDEIQDARETADAQGRSVGSNLALWLSSDPNIPPGLKQAADQMTSAEANFDRMRQLSNERAAHNRQALGDWLDGLWAGIKKRYDDAIEAINNGTWKTGLCKLGVDAGFFIIETAIGAALSAVLTPAVAALLKVFGRVAEVGSALVRVGVRATRLEVRESRLLAAAEKDFPRKIDTSKELTKAEKKVLGEENQGTTTNTPDAGKTEPGGAAQRGRDRNATGKAGENYYREKYGGRSLTSREGDGGNGIDNITDNGPGKGIVFKEIKTSEGSDFRLRGEENLGGEDFVRNRLEKMARGDSPYGSMSEADKNYAEDLLDRIRAGEPTTYEKVKLQKNADGSITERGTEPWARNDDALRSWRDQQQRKRERHRQRRDSQPGTAENPPTGPPEGD